MADSPPAEITFWSGNSLMFTHFSSNGLLVKIFLRHLDKSVIFDKHDAVVLNEDGVKYVIACTSALGTGELRNAFD